MASEQTTRRSSKKNSPKESAVEKDRVPKMTTHFENLAEEANKSPSPKKEGSEKEEEISLEEMSNLRAQAQQKANEAIRAAEEKYSAALKAARERGSAAKDSCFEKVAEGGAVGKEAAVGAKDRAVAAGWTAAHFSTETAVEGTMAAARAVKGAAEKASEIAVKPLSAAKEAVVSAGETAKEFTARKKEEAWRGLGDKQLEGTEKEQEYSHSATEERSSDEGTRAKGQSGPTVLGAIGETIVEIAQTTKDLVIGEDDPDTRRDRSQ